MELREVNVAVTLTVLALFAVCRGLCAEATLCKLSCQRNVLRDLFDDLQDSINTRGDNELQMFYRHFCGTKYNQTWPCKICEDTGSLGGLTDDRERRLFLGIREFICNGNLQTWKGIRLAYSDPSSTGCWRLITTMKSLVAPLCNNELAESTSRCSPANNDEKTLLNLASTTARLFNCTGNKEGASSKQLSGQHLRSSRAQGGCDFRRVINCITDFIAIYTSKVATAAKKKQELKQAHAHAICQWRQGSCTAKHSAVDCTASQRAAVERFEGGLFHSVTELCLDDAALLKNLSKTLHCWDLLKLNGCFNPSGLLTAPALFSARHTLKQCRDIEVKMIRCLDSSLGDACGERPDVQGTRNLVSALLSTADCGAVPARSCSAAGSAAALLTLPVAAALAARLPF